MNDRSLSSKSLSSHSPETPRPTQNELKTTHPRICRFYEENPDMDFESVNLDFIHWMERSKSKSESACYNDRNQPPYEESYLFQYNELQQIIQPTTHKNEDNLPVTLSRLFPTEEIEEVSKEIIVLHKHPFNIVVHKVDSDVNVSSEEMVKDVLGRGCHGILYSCKTGFIDKPHFHMDILGKRIIIYIHALMSNDVDATMRTAVHMIQHMSLHLETHGPSPDLKPLSQINQEYQAFIAQKEEMLENLKKSCVKQLEQWTFPCLEQYLVARLDTTPTSIPFICDLCNKFDAKNLKALAAHKRGCNKKLNK